MVDKPVNLGLIPSGCLDFSLLTNLYEMMLYAMYFTYAGGVLSDYGSPPYPRNIQSYWAIPRIVSYSFEFGIFILLGLSGEDFHGYTIVCVYTSRM